jgi:glycosyltransferase involved in cell wall biosynthesis
MDVMSSGVKRRSDRTLKVLFLIRSLNYGGAERQLVLLARGLSQRGHDVAVALFYSGGPLEKDLREAGVRIRPLYKGGRWDTIGFLFRLTQVVREEWPGVLHSYLWGANLMTAFLKPLFPTIKIVWGVRNSVMDFSRYDWLSKLTFKVTCWLSRFPDAIILNSYAGRDYHLSLGYPAEKSVVIPNGIDTERFRPDPAVRNRIRQEWRVNEEDKLIGLVGRLDPMKDHAVFLEAASLLVKEREHLRFVCVGDGPDDYRTRLRTVAKDLQLEDRLLWVGNRKDMPAVYNALDIGISSSAYGEGISNVIGEAMACGVPYVVTDVGDSAWVVGDTGKVVPPQDSVALKNAIVSLLDHTPQSPSQIRLRITERLSVAALIQNTERILGQVACMSGTSTHLQLFGAPRDL